MSFSVTHPSHTHTHLQVRHGERKVSVPEGSAADVHLPLEELRPVVALLPGGVEVHQPVSLVVAHPGGLTVPVDHLGGRGSLLGSEPRASVSALADRPIPQKASPAGRPPRRSSPSTPSDG